MEGVVTGSHDIHHHKVMHSEDNVQSTNLGGRLPFKWKLSNVAGGAFSSEYEEGTNSVIGNPVDMDIRFTWNDSKILLNEEEILVVDSVSRLVKKLSLTLNKEEQELIPSRVYTLAGANIDDFVDPFESIFSIDFIAGSKKSSELFVITRLKRELFKVSKGILTKLADIQIGYSDACTSDSLLGPIFYRMDEIVDMLTVLEAKDEYLYLIEKRKISKINLSTMKLETVYGCKKVWYRLNIESFATYTNNGQVMLLVSQNNQIYQLSQEAEDDVWTPIAGNGNSSSLDDKFPENSPALDMKITPKKMFVTLDQEIIVLEQCNRIIRIKNNKTSIVSSDPLLKDIEITSIVQSSLTKEIFISDYNNNVVRKIRRDGSICTVFGSGAKYYFGDKGPASKSNINAQSLHVSTYIESDIITSVDVLDTVKIRVIDENLEIRTLFNKEFLESEMSNEEGKVLGVFRARYGQLYISVMNQIYKVIDSTKLKRVVGLMSQYSGDGSAATDSILSDPTGVLYSRISKRVYIADSLNNRIRMVEKGIISTLIESENNIISIHERKGRLYFLDPYYLKFLDLKTNTVSIVKKFENMLLFADGIHVLENEDVYICNHEGILIARANGSESWISSEQSSNSNAISFLSNGDAIIVHKFRSRVSKMKVDGTWELVAIVKYPSAVIVSSRDEVYIAHDRFVSKIENGKLIRIVGSDFPTQSFSNPLETRFAPIRSLSFGETDEELYFTETTRFVWKVKGNKLTKVAGGIGDGLPATQARIQCVSSFYVNIEGEMIIADSGDHAIRKVSNDGTISTLYGIPGVYGYNEEDDASKTLFNTPKQVSLANNGDLFVYDSKNYCIRKISHGKVTIVVGTPLRKFGMTISGMRGNETFIDPSTSFAISPKSDFIFFANICSVYKLKLNDENALVERVYNNFEVTIRNIAMSTDGLSLYFLDGRRGNIKKLSAHCPEGYRISMKNFVCTNSTQVEEVTSYMYVLPLSAITLLSISILGAILVALGYHVMKNRQLNIQENNQTYNFISDTDEPADDEDLKIHNIHTNNKNTEPQKLIEMEP